MWFSVNEHVRIHHQFDFTEEFGIRVVWTGFVSFIFLFLIECVARVLTRCNNRYNVDPTLNLDGVCVSSSCFRKFSLHNMAFSQRPNALCLDELVFLWHNNI